MLDLLGIFGKGWRCGGDETPCGSGSTYAATESIRAVLPLLLNGLPPGTSIADVGCGDMHWIKPVLAAAKHSIDYRGYDLVPRNPQVMQLDITRQPLPQAADWIICRDVLIHFPTAVAHDVVQHLLSMCDYFLSTSYWDVSNFPRHDWTADPHKCFAPINLMVEPFSLGEPLLMLPEPHFQRFVGLWRGHRT